MCLELCMQVWFGLQRKYLTHDLGVILCQCYPNILQHTKHRNISILQVYALGITSMLSVHYTDNIVHSQNGVYCHIICMYQKFWLVCLVLSLCQKINSLVLSQTHNQDQKVLRLEHWRCLLRWASFLGQYLLSTLDLGLHNF